MIQRASSMELPALGALAALLWPGHTAEEMAEEFADLLKSENAALFLWEEEGQAVGFAQCQLRFDYVEGSQTSPVGYLEGIFVRPAYRLKGGAAALLRACEQWAKEKGCREFASDCELENTESLHFHLQVGFEEASRNIHFIKEL